MSINC